MHGGAQHRSIKGALVQPFERHRHPVARIFTPIREVERFHLLLRNATPLSDLSHEIRQPVRTRAHLTSKRNVVKLDDDVPLNFPRPVVLVVPSIPNPFIIVLVQRRRSSHLIHTASLLRPRRRRPLARHPSASVLARRPHDVSKQRRPPIRQLLVTKFTRHLLRFPRALQLPSRHALGVRPPRTRARVVQLVFASIASIHTSVTHHRSRAREAHKKIDRSIDLARKAREQIVGQIDPRPPSAVSSPRLLSRPSLNPTPNPHPRYFHFFLKKATFSSHTRTTFSNQKISNPSRRRFGVSRAFSVVPSMNRGIVASSRRRRRVVSRVDSRRDRARARTSRPSVSPSRHIQHTSSIVVEKTDARASRQSSRIDRVNARAARGLFLSHEPSRVPPLPVLVPTRQSIRMNESSTDRPSSSSSSSFSFSSRVPSPLPSSARDVDGGGSIVPARRRTRPPIDE